MADCMINAESGSATLLLHTNKVGPLQDHSVKSLIQSFENVINNLPFSLREECSNKGGTEDGSCASGYGVCCTCKFIKNNKYIINLLLLQEILLLVVANCGAALSENNTYFESEGEEDSHCSIQVCKGKDNIVQVT